MHYKKYFALFISILTCSIVLGQSFEIRTVNKGFGIIGVQLRQVAGTVVGTSNHVTDIVFGLKWNSSYNVGLSDSLSSAFNIKKSGSVLSKNGFNYQAFYADNTPFLLPSNWLLNNWVDILSVSNTKNGVDTGSFSICGTGFDVTTNPNLGIDLIDYTPAINGTATGVILPVTLLAFEVTPADTSINLTWKTSAEINNRGFVVQRSEVTQAKFDSLGWVSAAKGYAATYSFIDTRVVAGVEYFYRLKQLDYDGDSSYSSIRNAILRSQVSVYAQLSPNPANKILNVYFSMLCPTQTVNIRIINGGGKPLKIFKDVMQPGKTLQLDISNIAAGYYLLNITGQNDVKFNLNFIKI